MFDHTHYVPILRWKAAEHRALRQIPDEKRLYFTPLIELVPPEFRLKKMRKARDLSGLLQALVGQLASRTRGFPFFLDLCLLALTSDNVCRVWRGIDTHASGSLVKLIPVIQPTFADAVISEIAETQCRNSNGVCLRIPVTSQSLNTLDKTIGDLTSTCEIDPSLGDLVIDFGVCGAGNPGIPETLGCVPHLMRWRTLTVVSGAFPVDLTHLPANNEYEQQRLDWINWYSQVVGRNGLLRLPTYGDYTIQHPEFRLRDVTKLTPSASIRYTADKHWVIMRGHGLRKSEDFQQFPAQAEMLMDRSEYSGEAFSPGDAYVAKMATGENGTGNLPTWLQAGFSHHIMFVIDQIAQRVA